jgi:hypothetical protein
MVAGDFHRAWHCECNGRRSPRPIQGRQLPAPSSGTEMRVFGLAGQLEDRS